MAGTCVIFWRERKNRQTDHTSTTSTAGKKICSDTNLSHNAHSPTMAALRRAMIFQFLRHGRSMPPMYCSSVAGMTIGCNRAIEMLGRASGPGRGNRARPAPLEECSRRFFLGLATSPASVLHLFLESEGLYGASAGDHDDDDSTRDERERWRQRWRSRLLRIRNQPVV